MSVFHGHAVAVRAERKIGVDDARTVERSQQLARFRFHLVFFFGDVGNHVAQDVHGRDAGIARAADGLHGGDKNLVDAEAAVQRRQRQHQSNGGAVGIGDHEAAVFLVPLLRLDERNMVAVDLGDDQRNVLSHTKRAGVRNHGMACFGKGRLDLLRGRGVKGGKDQLGRRFVRRGGRDFHRGDLRRDRHGQVPLGGFWVKLAGRAVRCREPCDLKPWVFVEQLDESLPDGPGSAEYADWNLFIHGPENLILASAESLTTETRRHGEPREDSPQGSQRARRNLWVRFHSGNASSATEGPSQLYLNYTLRSLRPLR